MAPFMADAPSSAGASRSIRSSWTAAIAEAPDLPQALKDRIDGIGAKLNHIRLALWSWW